MPLSSSQNCPNSLFAIGKIFDSDCSHKSSTLSNYAHTIFAALTTTHSSRL